jgi:hypothetical protein
LAGSAPSHAAQCHDNRPTQETLADAITAMHNNTRPTPTLDELQQTMKGVEEMIEARLAAIGVGINSHTSLATETLGSGITAHTTRTTEMAATSHFS